MGEQDGRYIDSLSQNDIGDHGTDEPGQDTGATDASVEQSPDPGQDAGTDTGEPDTGHDTGDADTSGEQSPGQDAGTDAGGADTGHDTADKDDKEVSDSADHEQIVTIIEDDDAKEWREDISSQLSELMKPDDETGITERLDTMIMLLTPEETEDVDGIDGIESYAAAVIPFEGYEGWTYPINMQFQVYPYGMGNWMRQTQSFDDAGSFSARYEEIVSLCQEGGTLKDFYVEYIWEDYGSDERLVYDYEAATPEPTPDPGEEETKETVALLLSHLEGINTTLADMTLADLEYYQAVKDYQADMLELHTANTVYSLLTCIGVFGIFALLTWSEFFRRMR